MKDRAIQRETRPCKSTDNEEIEKAIHLIFELMDFNANIEPTLWAGAVAFVLINGYKRSGFTYDQFREEIAAVFEHYKAIFDEQ